jgi:hypothetical protein
MTAAAFKFQDERHRRLDPVAGRSAANASGLDAFRLGVFAPLRFHCVGFNAETQRHGDAERIWPERGVGPVATARLERAGSEISLTDEPWIASLTQNRSMNTLSI